MKVIYTALPQPRPDTRIARRLRLIKGLILSPLYWLIAHVYHTPGLAVRYDLLKLGMYLLRNKERVVPRTTVLTLLSNPLDSVRYFEFDFMYRALGQNIAAQQYLDVSSPRLFFLNLLYTHRTLKTVLLNPDKMDLALTKKLIQSLDLDEQCTLYDCLVNEAPFAPESFDMITSMSVIEHIPHDTEAVQHLWNLLRPGGVLLLSVPCAVEAVEEYIDYNEYGLLTANDQGFVFGQRFYDEQLLRENIFAVTGEPASMAVYGERVAGTFEKSRAQKVSDPNYPYWREPYVMGREYTFFDSLSALPGWGVVAMKFVKSGITNN